MSIAVVAATAACASLGLVAARVLRARTHAAPDTAPGPPTNWLVGVQGPIAGKTFLVGQRVATIGRAPQNLIQVPAPEVSRVHCQVFPEGEGLRVVDLKSRQGTFVNGERITSAVIYLGDELRVGTALFVFQPLGPEADATRDWKKAGPELSAPTDFGGARRNSAARAITQGD